VLGDASGRESGPRFRVSYDQTDDPVIPRRGAAVETRLRWYQTSPGATRGFAAGMLRASRFQPITRPASVFLTAEGGTTFGATETGRDQFALGGTNGLLAYGSNELRGNEYLLLTAGYLHDLWRLPPFVGKKVYVATEVEAAKMGGGSPWASDVVVGLVAQTAFGPLLVGVSAGNEGHRRWFFRLGRVF
jgi:NTE family protein